MSDLVDPAVAQLVAMRKATEWTGEIYEIQVANLKRAAMLIAGAKVTISLDSAAKSIGFSFGAPVAEPLPGNLASHLKKLEQVVAAVLGPGWRVTMAGHEQPAPESRGPAPQSPRGRGPKKGRQRRRRK